MARMSPLEFLRACGRRSQLPAAIIIYGPQVFLREYALDTALECLGSAAGECLRMQLGANDTPAALLSELSGLSLFAPARVIVCRVARPGRARIQSGTDEDDGASPRSSDAQLAEAIAKLPASVRLLLLYEHERAPAAVNRAAERCGLAVVCSKPFANQVEQYARLFARRLRLELSADACAHLVERCQGDLGTVHNALALIAVELGAKARVGLEEVRRPFSGVAPELFDLARCVSAAQAGRFLALLDRACALGRDTVEVLAVEIVPTLRRMLLAASMLNQGHGRTQIARALGMAPQSPAVESAMDGAARLGLDRIRKAYREAVELDVAFKTGLVRERETALCRLMLELN
jgi:DNA polymerase III delta subunit